MTRLRKYACLLACVTVAGCQSPIPYLIVERAPSAVEAPAPGYYSYISIPACMTVEDEKKYVQRCVPTYRCIDHQRRYVAEGFCLLVCRYGGNPTPRPFEECASRGVQLQWFYQSPNADDTANERTRSN